MELAPFEVTLPRLKGLDGTQRLRLVCQYQDAREIPRAWPTANLPEGAVIAEARYDPAAHFQHLEIISEVQS